MGAWTSLAVATTSLRRFVNDSSIDRFVKEKLVIGAADGSNKTFLTWDDRIIPSSLSVTVDFVAATVASQDTDATTGLNLTGEFTLQDAPARTAAVRAQYYYQYFTDQELQEALEMASQEIVESDDVTAIVPGMKYAALNIAGSFAYQRLAARWAQKMSNRFLVLEEPANDDNGMRPNLFLSISRQMWDQGVKLRDSFYMRHGRRNAPAFAMYKPRIGTVGPRS